MITFYYTKEDGTITDRVAIPLVRPTDKWFTIDISELDLESQALMSAEYEQIYDEYQGKVSDLMNKYDCKHMFRQFFQSKMTNFVEE